MNEAGSSDYCRTTVRNVATHSQLGINIRKVDGDDVADIGVQLNLLQASQESGTCARFFFLFLSGLN